MKCYTLTTTAIIACALLGTICRGTDVLRAGSPEDHKPIILDDDDGNDGDVGLFTIGHWYTQSNPAGQSGKTYLHDGNHNKGGCGASFTARLPVAGYYQVDMRWTGGDDHSDSVPVDIVHADGTLRTHVDQTAGGVWFPLGVHRFEVGDDGGVVIRNGGTSRTVIVDAVRFVYTGGTITDNATAGAIETTGTWHAQPSTGNACYGNGQLRTQPDGSGEAMATFTPKVTEDGRYEVWLWWGRQHDLATNVPVFIDNGDKTETVIVDQRTFGDAWLRLGIFEFSADREAHITIRSDNVNGFVVADAMMVLPYTAYRAEAARARLTKDFPPLGPVPVSPVRLEMTNKATHRVTLIAFGEDTLIVRSNGTLIAVPTDDIARECLLAIYQEYADPSNAKHQQFLARFERGDTGADEPDAVVAEDEPKPTTPSEADLVAKLHEQAGKLVEAQVERWLVKCKPFAPQMHLVETDHFLICSAWKPVDDEALGKVCEKLYDKLCESFDLTADAVIWPTKLPVVVFWSENQFIRFCQEVDHPNLGDLKQVGGYCGSTLPGMPYVVLNGVNRTVTSDASPKTRFFALLVHETTHAFNAAYLGINPLPSWFNEGIAEYLSADLVPGCSAGMRWGQATTRAISERTDISPMFDRKQIIATRDLDEYGLAQSVVRFMHAGDRKAFIKFYGLLKQGKMQEAAIVEAYQFDLDGLVERWKKGALRRHR